MIPMRSLCTNFRGDLRVGYSMSVSDHIVFVICSAELNQYLHQLDDHCENVQGQSVGAGLSRGGFR